MLQCKLSFNCIYYKLYIKCINKSKVFALQCRYLNYISFFLRYKVLETMLMAAQMGSNNVLRVCEVNSREKMRIGACLHLLY
jgi:hypothetical protein